MPPISPPSFPPVSLTNDGGCTEAAGMCVHHDGSDCPSNCAISTPLPGATSAYAFHGGSTCNTGLNMCGCPTADAYSETTLATAEDANPLECAELCRADASCQYALFKLTSGKCLLFTECNGRETTWVGQNGGVQFEKWRPPPAPPLVPPSIPPPLPPLQPPKPALPPIAPVLHSGLVDLMSVCLSEFVDDYGCPEWVKGIQIWTQWANVEPQEGQYNFTILTASLQQVVALGRFVVIKLNGNNKPTWLYDRVPQCIDTMSVQSAHKHSAARQMRPHSLAKSPR
jgi:hypothetical protein